MPETAKEFGESRGVAVSSDQARGSEVKSEQPKKSSKNSKKKGSAGLLESPASAFVEELGKQKKAMSILLVDNQLVGEEVTLAAQVLIQQQSTRW